MLISKTPQTGRGRIAGWMLSQLQKEHVGAWKRWSVRSSEMGHVARSPGAAQKGCQNLWFLKRTDISG